MKKTTNREAKEAVIDLTPKVETATVRPKAGEPDARDSRYFLVRCTLKEDFRCHIGGVRYALKQGETRVVPNCVYAVLKRNGVIYSPSDTVVVREN